MANHIIALNPDNFAPQEVIEAIVPLTVEYVDFDGKLQSGVIEIHTDLLSDVRRFFELSLETKFPIEKVVRSSDPKYLWDDDKLLDDNASSRFNYRFIKDTATPSLHGLGRAIDINTKLNPCIRFIEGRTVVNPLGAYYEPTVAGTLTKENPLVIFLKNCGWEWGGDWLPESGRIDYQHFQKAPVSK
jgi:hypothetical protein